jgi:hypothetical protein
VLLRLLAALADCCALGAGADFDACCFAEDELLDFRLFLPFCADTGSVNKMKAEASTTKANVSFCWCFGLYMILLLSYSYCKRFFSILNKAFKYNPVTIKIRKMIIVVLTILSENVIMIFIYHIRLMLIICYG